MINKNTFSLYEAKKAGVFQVVSVPDIDLLEGLGLRTGTRIKVQNRYVFGGPVLLRVEDAYSVALGKNIAKQINVSEININVAEIDTRDMEMPDGGLIAV